MLSIKSVIVLFFSLYFSINIVRADWAGQPAPNCELMLMNDGQSFDWASLEGKVVYLDFWASWCVPCVQSFPFMTQMQRELKGQGLVVIAVNVDEELKDAEGFLSRYPAGFTVVADPNQQCAKHYNVKAMPSSYVIDRKGLIRDVHLGFRRGEAEAFRKVVERILAE
ncbi:TlpA family protein disulfide reductase [Methylotuvimicrobium sp.]|uniref:TlpA family protein disulfide reductase n=1 Tax=Methylotuvimicrobium sp. TaxID=2822413 RepID=UPI003D64CDDD